MIVCLMILISFFLKYLSKITKSKPIHKCDNCRFEISGSYRIHADEKQPYVVQKKLKNR